MGPHINGRKINGFHWGCFTPFVGDSYITPFITGDFGAHLAGIANICMSGGLKSKNDVILEFLLRCFQILPLESCRYLEHVTTVDISGSSY